MDSADARRIVPAVLHTAQAIDKPLRDFFLADDPDDSTHAQKPPLAVRLIAAPHQVRRTIPA
jgi:hypothetical protein